MLGKQRPNQKRGSISQRIREKYAPTLIGYDQTQFLQNLNFNFSNSEFEFLFVSKI